MVEPGPRASSAEVEGPLARLREPLWSDPRLVWWALLDDRYLVEVVRPADDAVDAELRVFDTADGNRRLMRESVVLVDGARFGPDIADVAAWQSAAITAVDGRDGTEP